MRPVPAARTMAAMMRPKLQPELTVRCELAHAAGLEDEACPGPACAYWDEPGGCALASLRADLGGNPELTHMLLGLRERLGGSAQAHPAALPGVDP